MLFTSSPKSVPSLRVVVLAYMCMCHAVRLNVKGLLGAAEESRTGGKGKDPRRQQQRQQQQRKAVMAKGKNEAHISRPVYDDDDGDAGNTHTHTKGRILLRCHRCPPGSRSATASKGCEPLEGR